MSEPGFLGLLDWEENTLRLCVFTVGFLPQRHEDAETVSKAQGVKLEAKGFVLSASSFKPYAFSLSSYDFLYGLVFDLAFEPAYYIEIHK